MQSPEERRAHQRAYYSAHKKEIAVRHKAYGQSHRKEQNAYSKIYHATHRKEHAAYAAAHRENAALHSRIYYATHREKCAARAKVYNVAHQEELAIQVRLHKYGLSKVAFETLIENQGGGCAICRRIDWNGKGPHVDHNHITGRVRGILCFQCNAALGLLDDNILNAEHLVEYLSHSEYGASIKKENP